MEGPWRSPSGSRHTSRWDTSRGAGEALFTEFTHFTSSKLRKMERFSWKGSLKADLAA